MMCTLKNLTLIAAATSSTNAVTLSRMGAGQDAYQQQQISSNMKERNLYQLKTEDELPKALTGCERTDIKMMEKVFGDDKVNLARAVQDYKEGKDIQKLLHLYVPEHFLNEDADAWLPADHTGLTGKQKYLIWEEQQIKKAGDNVYLLGGEDSYLPITDVQDRRPISLSRTEETAGRKLHRNEKDDVDEIMSRVWTGESIVKNVKTCFRSGYEDRWVRVTKQQFEEGKRDCAAQQIYQFETMGSSQPCTKFEDLMRMVTSKVDANKIAETRAINQKIARYMATIRQNGAPKMLMDEHFDAEEFPEQKWVQQNYQNTGIPKTLAGFKVATGLKSKAQTRLTQALKKCKQALASLKYGSIWYNQKEDECAALQKKAVDAGAMSFHIMNVSQKRNDVRGAQGSYRPGVIENYNYNVDQLNEELVKRGKEPMKKNKDNNSPWELDHFTRPIERFSHMMKKRDVKKAKAMDRQRAAETALLRQELYLAKELQALNSELSEEEAEELAREALAEDKQQVAEGTAEVAEVREIEGSVEASHFRLPFWTF